MPFKVIFGDSWCTRNRRARDYLTVHICRAAGTLKDDQHCYLCGQNGHRQFECPNRTDDIYKLPTQMQEKVDDLYQRDVARMAGDAAPTGATRSLPRACAEEQGSCRVWQEEQAKG